MLYISNITFLRYAATMCADLSVVWLVAAFTSFSAIVLMENMLFATVTAVVSLFTEEYLSRYDA